VTSATPPGASPPTTTALPDQDWVVGANRVAVHGLGREGRSVVRHVREANPTADILVLDDAQPGAEDRAFAERLGADLVTGAAAAAATVVDVDLVVRSPGVPLSHPAQRAARAAGVPVTTALNIFFAVHGPDNVVGVTATKGKSTTASLLGHLLASAGRRVAVAGNVGLSVLDLDVLPGDIHHVVLELSSYQLADLRGHLAIGAWLNLHRDHHAWHGGAEAYAAAKGRIVDLSDRLVANAADAQVMARARAHPAVTTFDATTDPMAIGSVEVAAEVVADTIAGSALVGTHNMANLAAVLTIGTLLDVELDTMLGGVATFAPLPHRLEVVHDDGRIWVDDSIATIPEAAVAALDAFPDLPVTLVAGGFDRDQDHAPLLARLAARAEGTAPVAVVALPDTGHRLARELQAHPHVDVTVVADLAEAVVTADATTPDPGVVLLSPAAASFNQFSSFEERGTTFAELARSLA
jgi:UDP-N-acetylmuramoylalanine--D-glutamate ligase